MLQSFVGLIGRRRGGRGGDEKQDGEWKEGEEKYEGEEERREGEWKEGEEKYEGEEEERREGEWKEEG